MKSVILEDSKCLHDFYIVPVCYFERLAVKMWNCDREEPHPVICEQVFFPSWFCKKKLARVFAQVTIFLWKTCHYFVLFQ